MLDKADWIWRFTARLIALQPGAPSGSFPQVAESFWYYLRHQSPEETAEARAAGRLRALPRRLAWIQACGRAIQLLDPQLADQEAQSLAERLWEADWVRAVDPYVMASALWEQAALMSCELNGNAKPGPTHH
jgi:hypothetical protein